MAQKIHKKFCTVFKRSDSEKRLWNLSKEVDEQRAEIESLRAEIESLKKEREISHK